MIGYGRVILIIIVALQFSGCTTVTIPHAMEPMNGRMMDAMEPKVSTVNNDEAEEMIVLTLTQDVHSRLTEGKGIRPQPSKGIRSNAEVLPVAYKNFLNELSNRYGLTRVADWPLQSISARCLVLQATGSVPRDEIIASLSQDPRVEVAQELNLFNTLGNTYNDPYLDLQHGFHTMQVERSHQWATGEHISIAIVDTGVDISHQDLHDRVVLARNFVDQDSIAFQSDLHGTAVAAVIGATANNDIGIVGVAPRARLLTLKGCWQTTPDNTDAVCSSFTLAKSIDFAVLQNVDIINLSLSGPPDPLLELLIKRAIKKGISVVGAFDANEPSNFPAYIDGVLAVSNSSDKSESDFADVSAPGNKIISVTSKGDYDFFSGSSISAAHVSGLVALILERRPHLTPSDTLSLMKSTSSVTRGTENAHSVNACKAVAAAIGTGECQLRQ